MDYDQTTTYFTDIDDAMWLNMAKRRRNEAEEKWNKLNLKTVREKNKKLYLADYVKDQLVDERYQEIYVDNRQFTSIRTIVPFLTARVTAAEVIPANSTDVAIQFAHDFEKVLQKHAEKQQAKAKIRLAVEDLLKGTRIGILKWRYNGKTIILEHVNPESVILGSRSKLYEEPDYLCHKIERSISDLVKQFPDKKDEIFKLFGITKGVPSQLEKIEEIKEEWLWIDNEDERVLTVGWSWQNYCFGKIKDPNWDENDNIIEEPMIPFVFFNVLNDGSGYIDNTSYIEQAEWLQTNYNKRGQVIAENAKYGGTGVPIFAKGSIQSKDVAKIKFSPVQRILLDSNDMNKSFTTWRAENLPQYIVEDKYDERNSIDNIWGTPNIFRGEQSRNNTLGQDIIVRDQAEGRLSDLIDCMEFSMTRFYQLEAQLMYRYFDDKQYYNYIGNDGNFVSVVISNKDIAKNLGIQINVKAGTSLAIDRAQKRATIMKLLDKNRIGTLTTYKELDIFDDPEAVYKEYVMEQLDPKTQLEEVDKQIFNREANQDLMIIIGGGSPDEREDVEEEYVEYLTEWLLTDKYKLLREKSPKAAERVSEFVDAIIIKAKRKANKLAMQSAIQQEQNPMIPPEMIMSQPQSMGQKSNIQSGQNMLV